MNGTEPRRTSPPPSRAPRAGLKIIGAILGAMALLSVYSNIQRARQNRIETVTITPITTPTPAPSPAAP